MDVRPLFLSTFLSDVTVLVQDDSTLLEADLEVQRTDDGKLRVPAHRLVLAQRCPVFNTLCHEEGPVAEWSLADKPWRLVRPLLEFLYFGRCTSIKDIEEELGQLAFALQVTDLSEICDKAFLGLLDETEVITGKAPHTGAQVSAAKFRQTDIARNILNKPHEPESNEHRHKMYGVRIATDHFTSDNDMDVEKHLLHSPEVHPGARLDLDQLSRATTPPASSSSSSSAAASTSFALDDGEGTGGALLGTGNPYAARVLDETERLVAQRVSANTSVRDHSSYGVARLQHQDSMDSTLNTLLGGDRSPMHSTVESATSSASDTPLANTDAILTTHTYDGSSSTVSTSSTGADMFGSSMEFTVPEVTTSQAATTSTPYAPFDEHGSNFQANQSTEGLDSQYEFDQPDIAVSGDLGAGTQQVSLENVAATSGFGTGSGYDNFRVAGAGGGSLYNSPSGLSFEDQAAAKPKVRVQKKDWNKEFQILTESLDKEDLDEQQVTQLYSRLANHAHDFVYAALLYGKIIISERYLPNDMKTIPPVDAGGAAGGEKYIVQNILFKFALDSHGLYRGDEFAMKAAGHDLKGLMSFYQVHIKGLHVPLMALVDYKGFRLIAVSILPIDSKNNSLIYGTDEASDPEHIIHADNQEFNQLMATAGHKLGLKGHHSKGQMIYGPADIEGHLGTDGKFYLLDFARSMPAQFPDRYAPQGSHLYRLLRPEFVKRNRVPLSSDAFSNFQDPQEAYTHDGEVKEASLRLINEVIPNFARQLDARHKEVEDYRLIEGMHREGINVRFLGLIRHHVKQKDVSTVLLIEMVARVCKNMLREQIRLTMEENPTPMEEPVRHVIKEFLNKLLGNRTESQTFWQLVLKEKIKDKFYEPALSREEMEPHYSLFDKVDKFALFTRIQEMTGMALAPTAMDQLRENPESFVMVDSDVASIDAKVKHMNIIDHALGVALSMEAEKRKDASASDRLFHLAFKKFEASVAASPDNYNSLLRWGKALTKQAARKKGTECQHLYDNACEKFNAIVNSCNENSDAKVMGLAYFNMAMVFHEKAKRYLSSNSSEGVPTVLSWYDESERVFEAAMNLADEPESSKDVGSAWNEMRLDLVRTLLDYKHGAAALERSERVLVDAADLYNDIEDRASLMTKAMELMQFSLHFGTHKKMLLARMAGLFASTAEGIDDTGLLGEDEQMIVLGDEDELFGAALTQGGSSSSSGGAVGAGGELSLADRDSQVVNECVLRMLANMHQVIVSRRRKKGKKGKKAAPVEVKVSTMQDVLSCLSLDVSDAEMSTSSVDVNDHKIVCTALWVCATVKHFRDALTETDVLPRLMAQMHTHDVPLLCHVVGAIAALSHSSTLRKQAYNLGMLADLIDLLSPDADMMLLQGVANVLAHCSHDTAARAQLRHKRVVHKLLDCFRLPSPEAQLHLLEVINSVVMRTFATDLNVYVSLFTREHFSIVLQLLQPDRSTLMPDTVLLMRLEAVRFLKRACVSSANQLILSELDLVGILMRLMREVGDPELQMELCTLVTQLSSQANMCLKMTGTSFGYIGQLEHMANEKGVSVELSVKLPKAVVLGTDADAASDGETSPAHESAHTLVMLSENSGYSMGMRVQKGRLQMGIFSDVHSSSTSEAFVSVALDKKTDANKWVHWCGVFDSSSFALYRNGTLVAEGEHAQMFPTVANNAQWLVGATMFGEDHGDLAAGGVSLGDNTTVSEDEDVYTQLLGRKQSFAHVFVEMNKKHEKKKEELDRKKQLDIERLRNLLVTGTEELLRDAVNHSTDQNEQAEWALEHMSEYEEKEREQLLLSESASSSASGGVGNERGTGVQLNSTTLKHIQGLSSRMGDLFVGQMADVRIWNYRMDAEQIRQMQHALVSTNVAKLLGCWSLNDELGCVATNAVRRGGPMVLCGEGASWEDRPDLRYESHMAKGAWAFHKEDTLDSVVQIMGDGNVLRCTQTTSWSTNILTDQPLDESKEWDVILEKTKSGTIMIGVCEPSHQKSGAYVGQSSSYYGASYYTCSPGYKYQDGMSANYGHAGSTGDVVRVQWDSVTRDLSFMHNGISLGVAYRVPANHSVLYPAVSLYDLDDRVRFEPAYATHADTGYLADTVALNMPRLVEEGAMAALVPLLEEGEVEEVAEEASNAIVALLGSGTGTDSKMDKSSLRAILTLATSSGSSVGELRTSACSALVACATNAENRTQLRSLGAAKRLLELIASEEDASIVKQACLALRNYCVDKETQREVGECDGIAVLMDMLERDEVAVLEGACAALGSCAMLGANRKLMQQRGAVDTLVRLVQSHNSELVMQATGALKSALLDSSMQSDFGDLSGPQILVSLLNSGTLDSITANACECLENAAKSKKVSAMIVSVDGVVDTLVPLLERKDLRVRGACMGAISQLSQLRKQSKVVRAHKDVHRLLAEQCGYKDSGNPLYLWAMTNAVHACSNLAKGATQREMMEYVGVVGECARLIDHEHLPLTKLVCSFLSHASEHVALLHMIRRSKIVAKLASLLRKADQSDEVSDYILTTLRNMCYPKGPRSKSVGKGGQQAQENGEEAQTSRVVRWSAEHSTPSLVIEGDTVTQKASSVWCQAYGSKPIKRRTTFDVFLPRTTSGQVFVGVGELGLNTYVGGSGFEGAAFYGSTPGYVYKNGSSKNYGKVLESGSVVSTTFDPEKGTLSFVVDGQAFGLAYTSETSLQRQDLYPVVSLYTMDDVVSSSWSGSLKSLARDNVAHMRDASIFSAIQPLLRTDEEVLLQNALMVASAMLGDHSATTGVSGHHLTKEDMASLLGVLENEDLEEMHGLAMQVMRFACKRSLNLERFSQAGGVAKVVEMVREHQDAQLRQNSEDQGADEDEEEDEDEESVPVLRNAQLTLAYSMRDEGAYILLTHMNALGVLVNMLQARDSEVRVETLRALNTVLERDTRNVKAVSQLGGIGVLTQLLDTREKLLDAIEGHGPDPAERFREEADSGSGDVVVVTPSSSPALMASLDNRRFSTRSSSSDGGAGSSSSSSSSSSGGVEASVADLDGVQDDDAIVVAVMGAMPTVESTNTTNTVLISSIDSMPKIGDRKVCAVPFNVGAGGVVPSVTDAQLNKAQVVLVYTAPEDCWCDMHALSELLLDMYQRGACIVCAGGIGIDVCSLAGEFALAVAPYVAGPRVASSEGKLGSYDKDHPIMQGVQDIVSGLVGLGNVMVNDESCRVLAYYDDDVVLVSERRSQDVGNLCLFVNLFPVSSAHEPMMGFNSQTDGRQLLHNVIGYAAEHADVSPVVISPDWAMELTGLACHALEQIAQQESEQVRLREEGVLEKAYHLLSTSNDMTIQRHACGLVRFAAMNETNKVVLQRFNILSALMRFVTSSEVNLFEDASAAIVELCENEENDLYLRDTGGVPVFMQFLRSTSDFVLEYALTRLNDCVIDDDAIDQNAFFDSMRQKQRRFAAPLSAEGIMSPEFCERSRFEFTRRSTESVTAQHMSTSTWSNVFGKRPFVRGRHEWTLRIDATESGTIMIGVCKDAKHFGTSTSYIGGSSTPQGWSYYGAGSCTYHNASSQTYGGSFKTGDVVCVKLDLNAGTLSYIHNEKDLGVAYTGLTGPLYAGISFYSLNDRITVLSTNGTGVAAESCMELHNYNLEHMHKCLSGKNDKLRVETLKYIQKCVTSPANQHFVTEHKLLSHVADCMTYYSGSPDVQLMCIDILSRMANKANRALSLGPGSYVYLGVDSDSRVGISNAFSIDLYVYMDKFASRGVGNIISYSNEYGEAVFLRMHGEHLEFGWHNGVHLGSTPSMDERERAEVGDIRRRLAEGDGGQEQGAGEGDTGGSSSSSSETANAQVIRTDLGSLSGRWAPVTVTFDGTRGSIFVYGRKMGSMPMDIMWPEGGRWLLGAEFVRTHEREVVEVQDGDGGSSGEAGKAKGDAPVSWNVSGNFTVFVDDGSHYSLVLTQESGSNEVKGTGLVPFQQIGFGDQIIRQSELEVTGTCMEDQTVELNVRYLNDSAMEMQLKASQLTLSSAQTKVKAMRGSNLTTGSDWEAAADVSSAVIQLMDTSMMYTGTKLPVDLAQFIVEKKPTDMNEQMDYYFEGAEADFEAYKSQLKVEAANASSSSSSSGGSGFAASAEEVREKRVAARTLANLVTNHFEGTMTHLSLWNVARSVREIQESLFRRHPQKTGGLVAYWLLNEGDADQIFEGVSKLNGIVCGSESRWATTHDLVIEMGDKETQLFAWDTDTYCPTEYFSVITRGKHFRSLRGEWRTVCADRPLTANTRWRLKLNKVSDMFVGVSEGKPTASDWVGSTGNPGWTWYCGTSSSTRYRNGSQDSYGCQLKSGDVLDVVYDAVEETLRFEVNGEDQGVCHTGVHCAEGTELYACVSTSYSGDEVVLEGVVDKYASIREENLAALQSIDILPKYLALSKEHGSGELAERSLDAVGKLMLYKQFREMMAVGERLSQVLELCSSEDWRMRVCALDTLLNSLSDEKNQIKMQQIGGLEKMLGMVHDDEVSVSSRACWVLTYSLQHPENQKKLLEIRGLETLISLLSASQLAVRASAVHAVAYSIQDANNVQEFQERGGLRPLLALMNTLPINGAERDWTRDEETMMQGMVRALMECCAHNSARSVAAVLANDKVLVQNLLGSVRMGDLVFKQSVVEVVRQLTLSGDANIRSVMLEAGVGTFLTYVRSELPGLMQATKDLEEIMQTEAAHSSGMMMMQGPMEGSVFLMMGGGMMGMGGEGLEAGGNSDEAVDGDEGVHTSEAGVGGLSADLGVDTGAEGGSGGGSGLSARDLGRWDNARQLHMMMGDERYPLGVYFLILQQYGDSLEAATDFLFSGGLEEFVAEHEEAFTLSPPDE